MIQLTMLAGIPLVTCNIILSNEVTTLLLGEKWNGIAPVFAWLSVGGLAAPLYSSTFWLFTSQNKTNQQMRYAVYTSAISVASFAIGVRWGAVGVSVANALAFDFIQTPLIVWAATRASHISLQDMAKAIAPILTAGAVTATLITTYCFYFSHKSLLEIVEVYSIAYVVFAFSLGLTPGGVGFISSSYKYLGFWTNK
jgi:PST family polysaccharide transporter